MADQDDDVFEDTSKGEPSLDTDRTGNGSIARQDTIDEGTNGLEKVSYSKKKLYGNISNERDRYHFEKKW